MKTIICFIVIISAVLFKDIACTSFDWDDFEDSLEKMLANASAKVEAAQKKVEGAQKKAEAAAERVNRAGKFTKKLDSSTDLAFGTSDRDVINNTDTYWGNGIGSIINGRVRRITVSKPNHRKFRPSRSFSTVRINNTGYMNGNNNGSVITGDIRVNLGGSGSVNTGTMTTGIDRPRNMLNCGYLSYKRNGKRINEKIENRKVYINNKLVYTAPPSNQSVCVKNEKVLLGNKSVFDLTATLAAITSSGTTGKSAGSGIKRTTSTRRPGHPTLSEYRDKLRSGEQQGSRGLRRGASRGRL